MHGPLASALVCLCCLLFAIDSTAGKRPPCQGRVDGTKCGTCQVCKAGLCISKDCGSCADCKKDKCVARPNESRCGGGDCGVCRNGSCSGLNVNLCPDPRCYACVGIDEGGGACTPVVEGSPCAGECGICSGAMCRPDSGECPECKICNASSFICEISADLNGSTCNDCGICSYGSCFGGVANDGNCTACHFCNDITGWCDPIETGANSSDCPTGATDCCNGACTNKQTDLANCGDCGTVCPAGKTCTNGRCVCPPQVCPTGQGWDSQTCRCVCGGTDPTNPNCLWHQCGINGLTWDFGSPCCFNDCYDACYSYENTLCLSSEDPDPFCHDDVLQAYHYPNRDPIREICY